MFIIYLEFVKDIKLKQLPKIAPVEELGKVPFLPQRGKNEIAALSKEILPKTSPTPRNINPNLGNRLDITAE